MGRGGSERRITEGEALQAECLMVRQKTQCNVLVPFYCERALKSVVPVVGERGLLSESCSEHVNDHMHRVCCFHSAHTSTRKYGTTSIWKYEQDITEGKCD